MNSSTVNDFELLGLPQQFTLDLALLQQAWKALQQQAHPDKHVHADAATQRQAMQWAVRINEAYQRLKSPLSRAAYLCELRGHPIRAEDNTAMSGAFLMQQMQWREALDEAVDHEAALEELLQEVQAEQKRLLQELALCLDSSNDSGVPVAVQAVRALMFVEKLIEQIQHKLEALDA